VEPHAYPRVWRGRYPADVYVTDLSHFDGIDDSENVPPPALKIAEFMRNIVCSATAREAGLAQQTALRCRRQPQRQRCQGHLVVQRSDVPAEIAWHFPICGDEGVIHGWDGSAYDLSSVVGAADGRTVRAVVPEAAYQLLVHTLFLDSECTWLIHRARPVRGGVELMGNEWDLENLMGFVAFEANHSSSRPHQRQLDVVRDAIDAVLPRP
jgi:hypothetical protein